MTKEDKDLLLKDLCARLPYSVKIAVQSWDEREWKYIDRVDVLYSVNGDEYIKSVNEDYEFGLEDIKPYLFPLSSMTVKQRDSYRFLTSPAYTSPVKLINFFHKNHIDYRGLIEKGLAIDATNLNIY